MTAVTRSQHHRAHLYHLISDLNVHMDNNPYHRLFPQYDVGRPDLPSRGNICFNICRTPMTNDAPQRGQTNAGIFSTSSANIAQNNPTQNTTTMQEGTAGATISTNNPPPPRYNNPGVDILSFMPGGLRRFFPGGVPAHLFHSNSNTTTTANNSTPSTTTTTTSSTNPLSQATLNNDGTTTPTAEQQAQRGSISQIILEFGIVETDSLGKNFF